MTRIGVVDYGAGNLVSIDQALLEIGARPTVVHSALDLHAIDGLIVPGVGAAAPAMERLREAGLVDPILAWIADGRPFLGICLGLQLLFDESEEDGAATLGVIAGKTTRLASAPTLPHTGWNQVERTVDHPLFDGIAPAADVYFVHSYAGAPHEQAVAIARTTHGAPFVSAIARANVLGVQFHPERSGEAGLRLLANFAAIVRSGAAALAEVSA
jgi:glutamine amidotransferase